jgi:hypothetical protein
MTRSFQQALALTFVAENAKKRHMRSRNTPGDREQNDMESMRYADLPKRDIAVWERFVEIMLDF